MPPAIDAADARWWQRGVIYQVYPQSFQDTDGDGVGDLAGVRARLDHFEWLGVDAVWLSPIFPSPMADFGYDVADYRGVDPLFGTLADLDRLTDDLHARGMRLLLDFVPNHTSDRHPWFMDARSSRHAAHRDWYIWRDPAPDGGPPNRLQSVFGGSAWELDERSGQYYFHAFLKEQPDLDWTNPEVRAAMADVMRFWFDRGIDGFRVDVIWLLGKGCELLADHEITGAAATDVLAGDRPGVHDIIAGLRGVADEYEDRLLIGEIYLPLERLVLYYGKEGEGVHLAFNFQLLQLAWQAEDIHAAIIRYEELLPAHGWPNWVLGNHDQPRVATRVGVRQARVAAMLLLTLRGTPTIYYGDEIGMPEVDVPMARQRDPQGVRGGRSRDSQRTPMRWDASAGAGFTTGRPWLPIGPHVARINVDAQRDDPRSRLTLHRRLLELRRREPALNVGAWRDLGRQGDVIAFERAAGNRRFAVVLNLGGRAAPVPGPAAALSGRIVLSASLEQEDVPYDGGEPLRGNEGVVVLLD